MERENVCLFGGRRGRTEVGIVGLGARGAPTKKYVWGFVWRACEGEATERCEGEAMASGEGEATERCEGEAMASGEASANDGDVDATR